MKKKQYLLTIIAIGTFSFVVYYLGCAQKINVSHLPYKFITPQRNIGEQKASRDAIQLNWKTYTSDRLGITFQYPDTWTKQGEESNAINRSGNVISIMVNFIDSVTQTTLLIEYHLAPNGTELYKYAQTQFNSSQGLYEKDGKQIMVARNKAIEGNKILSIDGKGNPINPPLKLISVNFLDKQQTGEIELQFKTPLQISTSEIVKFNQLLSTIKFIN